MLKHGILGLLNYGEMTVEYRRKSMQMQIEWTRECIRQLKGI